MISGFNKITVVAALCALTQTISLNAQEVNHVHPHKQEFRAGELIVKFKGESAVNIRRSPKGLFRSAGVDKVGKVLTELGAQEMEQLMPLTGYQPAPRRIKSYSGNFINTTDMSKMYLVKIDKDLDIQEAIDKLQELEEVEFAEPNYLVHALEDEATEVTYTDPMISEQYGLGALNLQKLWSKPVISDKRPVIAILDTGVDITHPDLADNIWENPNEKNGMTGYDDDENGYIDDLHGWDFVNNNAYIHDANGHGTHCAGIVAAVAGNGVGIVGANPDALIMPVVVLQSTGGGDIATIIKGIDYAAANGADIISMSLGGYGYSMAEEQALGKAYAKSIIVAAAGNDCLPIDPAKKCPNCGAYGAPMYPGAFTFVLGVEASTGDDRACFSNYDNDGPFFSTFGEERMFNYELRAPGVNILSTYPKGRYKYMNGTSMATPFAAGLISRLLQTNEYQNTEILYGDLIHSRHGYLDNLEENPQGVMTGDIDGWIASEMNDDNRPADLNFIGFVIDDTEDGDGDGDIDAGETVKIYPILRAGWGQANNIKVSIEQDELDDGTFYYTLDSDVDFGYTLSSYGKAQSANPIRLHVDENVVDGRQIIMHMTATCDNIIKKMDTKFVVTIENGVEIGGILDKNTTLYPNVHYIVVRPLMVPSGITLTIQPGTVIRFKDGTGIHNEGKIVANGTKDAMITLTKAENSSGIISYFTMETPSGSGFTSTFRYLNVSDLIPIRGLYEVPIVGKFQNCQFQNLTLVSSNSLFSSAQYQYCNFSDCILYSPSQTESFGNLQYCNISNISTELECLDGTLGEYGFSGRNNVIMKDITYKITPDHITLVKTTAPSYFGSAREDVVRRHVTDNNDDYGMAKYDFSNMLKQPYPEAHGLVWKILVNGYDAQDEFEEMPPLGVGKHKVEVFFNRVIDHSVDPMLSFGVRPPYTQRAISDDSSWRTDSVTYYNGRTMTDIAVSVYTAYITITGSMAIDGINRFYVNDAVDLDHFNVPLENQRFNAYVQASGSLSSGFMADPGLGLVNLMWEPQDENIDDIMGYNVYRYQVPENSEAVAAEENEAVCINEELLETTEFTDYNVIPGQTYYYYYKVLRSDLSENSPSKVVAAIPLSASKGDANGSLKVDIADVVTEIAYLTDQNPQPFIFEAADVNEDEIINILDVVATINIIINPNYLGVASYDDDQQAVYTIEDGILYVETPVSLGGIQVLIDLMDTDSETLEPLADLNGFELVNMPTPDNQYMLLAYSMSGVTLAPGKHALLKIGNANVQEVVLSNVSGQNVKAVFEEISGIAITETPAQVSVYPNPFVDEVKINYNVSESGAHNVKIAIFDASGRLIVSNSRIQRAGQHEFIWRASGKPAGTYLAKITIDGKQSVICKLLKAQ